MTIKPTGKSMKEFPNAFKYGAYCSPDADAYEVLNSNGSTMFTGTYTACENFIGHMNNKSRGY